MSSLFIRGETGEAKIISSLSDLKNLYNTYLKESLSNPNDILLFTSKGQIIHNIEMLEFFSDIHYFIYSKHFSQEIIKLFNNTVEKFCNPFSLNISINLNSIPDVNGVIPILEQNSKYLKNFTPQDFKGTLAKMMDFYDNFKLIYKTMKVNCNICDKIKECYQYQFEGVEMVFKHLNHYFEKCQQKKQEIENQAKIVKEKNNNTLKLYKESIEKLKVTELHPGMKNSRAKYLIDIYYNEKGIEKWEGRCIEQEKFLLDKIAHVETLISNEKNKMKNVKKINMTQLKNDWTTLTNEYDKLFREKSSKPFTMMSELGGEFSQFKSKLQSIIEIFNSNLYNSNPNYVTKVDEAVESIKLLKKKYSNITLLSNLQSYLEPVNQVCSKMKKSMEKIPLKISEFCNFCLGIKGSFAEIADKIDKYMAKLTDLENDFLYLQNPVHFPNTYQNSIVEIKRRIIFNKKILKDFDRLKGVLLRENLSRKQFLKENEKYLTPDYIKLLKFSEVRLGIDFQNNNELNTLPNVLSEEDEKIINAGGFLSDTIVNNTVTNALTESKNGSSIKGNSMDNSEDKKCDDVNLIKTLTTKLEELDTAIKIKDNEIKQYQTKVEQYEKKISSFSNEFKALNSVYDTMTENFFFQISIKDQKYEKKKKECENLKKYITNSISGSNIDTCPLCKENAMNSLEFKTTAQFIKEIHDKLSNRTKICAKLEKNFQDLLNQTTLIKTTFFIHLNHIIEKKNLELSKIKGQFENKIMYLEDLLSASNEKMIQEQSLKMNINQLEQKLQEANSLLADSVEEKKNLQYKLDEVTQKEGNIKLDYKVLQSKYDGLSTDYKTLENACEANRLKALQVSSEMVTYIQDNQKIKKELDNKNREFSNLKNLLTKLKFESNTEINSLNMKIEELNQKLLLKQKELDDNTKKLSQIKEAFNINLNDNSLLKQKINSLEIEISEKEKKIFELSETNKFTVTNNQNEHLNTKSNTNALTNEINLIGTDLLLSKTEPDDVIFYKRIEKGLKSIFVPHSEGIYVSINLSENIFTGYNTEFNNNYFKCKYILNLNSIEEELKELIIENSLIVIGKVGKLIDHVPTEKDNPYNLPLDNRYVLVNLEKIEYVIGFPGEEIVFRNYNILN